MVPAAAYWQGVVDGAPAGVAKAYGLVANPPNKRLRARLSRAGAHTAPRRLAAVGSLNAAAICAGDPQVPETRAGAGLGRNLYS